MKVLVVGSGGREHALVWKLAQSPKVTELFCAPGNPGMVGEAELVDIAAGDIPALAEFAEKNNIDLTVVGPEVPLANGIVDIFAGKGLTVAGPDSYAAQLEASKSFAKDFMLKYDVPTAGYRVFTDPDAAKRYVDHAGRKLVVKADGLCGGKGVLLCKTPEEAKEAIDQLMVKKRHGDAGIKVVIEEWLEGEEASFLVFSDGETVVPMPTSQDHKAVGEGDTGLNTGGMGAYSPAPVVTQEVANKVMERIITPVIEGMKSENHPFKGILYAGLMIDESGDPTVLEFNVRFGDPECQPLLMRLRSDLAEIFEAIVEGNLANIEVAWRNSPTVCVVLAAGGYPEKYNKGDKISGIEDTARLRDVVVFHAGTGLDQGELVTAGGRVLGVTALGDNVKDAIDRAYEAVELISWDGMYYRKDIGHRALSREKAPQVGVVMGSASDWEIMKNAVDALRVMGVQCEVRVLSAHRTPEEATQYAQHAAARGIKVIIAGAGWAAHLAGAMAANSILPVIGVPVGSSPLNGMDALLSTVQMPAGIPVATVAIGGVGAKNAGLMAAQILALGDPELSTALKIERKRLANKVLQADQNLANRALAGEPFFE